MNEICKYFFKFSGLSYFHFRRTFKNGTYVILSTNAEWPLYFIKQKTQIVTPVASQLFTNKSYFCPWKDNIPEKTLADAANHYGIRSAIAYVEKNDLYFDSFSFGSSCDDPTISVNNINNIDLFQKFSHYFLDIANKLITKASEQPIIVPPSLQDPNLNKLTRNNHFICKKQDFLKTLTANRLTLLSNNCPVMLKEKEVECIKYLAYGKSMKEVGRAISLSPRTVEAYLEKARLKLNCASNSELISLWWDNYT